MPDVSRGEYAREVRLHVIRRTIQLPILGPLAISQQVWTGHQITLWIADDPQLLRPWRVRYPAQTQKKIAGLSHLRLTRPMISQRDRPERAIAVQRDHLGPRKDFNIRRRLDPVRQIFGQRLL